jgi:hypothetical protein
MSRHVRRAGFQFAIGDKPFLRPVAHFWAAAPFEVIDRFEHNGWPHYLLRDPAGDTWTASQLDLSSTPSAWTDPQTSSGRNLLPHRHDNRLSGATGAQAHL